MTWMTQLEKPWLVWLTDAMDVDGTDYEPGLTDFQNIAFVCQLDLKSPEQLSEWVFFK